jgi:leucyl/phenylalanyl-tRNA--protein transferase
MTRGSRTELLMPEVILVGYQHGFFPMADDTGAIHWHCPDPRAVLPLEHLHISRSLRQVIRRREFTVTINKAFDEVIAGCADREDTWISDEIIAAYTALHEMGHAHSVEAWKDGELAGGLYGVSIGGAFFGESMFSRRSNASKVAFAYLADHLRMQDFRLLDTQYVNDFTASLGAVEIPDAVYRMLLADALVLDRCFM